MQGVREGVTRYNDQGGGVRGKGGGGGGKIIDNCRGIRTQKKEKIMNEKRAVNVKRRMTL